MTLARRIAFSSSFGDRTHQAARAARLLTVVILAAGLWRASTIFTAADLGIDLALYTGAARSWLAGSGFYPAWQLAPYTIAGHSPILYPPTLLWLLVPFMVLPALLWWAVPAALAAVALWRLQPPPWMWPLLAFCLAVPQSIGLMLHGNPVIWIAALTLAGVAFGWGGAFVLLKPSLIPFALLRIRSRCWWLVAGLLALVTLPLMPLLAQYPLVVLGAQGGGLLYSVGDVPLMLVPVIAWAARRSGSSRPRTLQRPRWRRA